jgi:hypothetical protein
LEDRLTELTHCAILARYGLDRANVGGAGSQHPADGQPWFHLVTLLLGLPQDVFEKIVLAVRLYRQLDEED